MQGGIEYNESKDALGTQLTSMYNNRVLASELFDFDRLSKPASIDAAVDRLKANFSRFAFWYIALIGLFNITFIFFNKMILIPILITVAAVYISTSVQSVNGIEITPSRVLCTCLGAQALLCIFSHKIFTSCIYFLALNGFCVLVIVIHGLVMKSTAEDSDL